MIINNKDIDTELFSVFVLQMTSTVLIMEEKKVLKNPDNAQPVELDVSVCCFLFFFFE